MSKAQTADVPLPVGADPENVDHWETSDGVTSRLVWSLPDPYPQEFQCDVRVVATQRFDGSIIIGDPVEEPLIYVDGVDFTVRQARTLATALINAVDLVGKWASK
jgi:hypothetical protein